MGDWVGGWVWVNGLVGCGGGGLFFCVTEQITNPVSCHKSQPNKLQFWNLKS